MSFLSPASSDRLSNFAVVVGDVAPPLEEPSILDGEGFLHCGHFNDAPPVGNDAVLTCQDGVRGRYVYVYIPNNFLTLCEVAVYAEGRLIS